jgi:cation transport regulator ChaC
MALMNLLTPQQGLEFDNYSGFTQPVWVFGYGSLIYKADFPYLERWPASIRGWQRRFWQGSHDHRGTPDAPGRVVTLVASPDRPCSGMAYLIEPHVFEHLDHREKNGYVRYDTAIDLLQKPGRECVEGTVYIAMEDNPAYLGPAPIMEIANHIRSASGPSGSNLSYLLELALALRELEIEDEHVSQLAGMLSG